MIHPSRRPSWLAIGALAVLLTACGSTDDASPTASGGSGPATDSASAPEAPGASATAETGETTSVFDLEVGDCFSAENDQLETVGVVACDEEHEYEVFSVFDHEAGGSEPYPGDDELIAYADEACQPAFEEYVGSDYQTSIWFITSLTPSAETWAVGDREIVCAVNQQDADEEPITVSESAAGSGE